MKFNSRFIAIALTVCSFVSISTKAKAQSLQFPATIGGAAFKLHSDIYTVANADVQTIWSKGKASSNWQGFAGFNANRSKAVIGTDIDLSYEFTKNGSAFVFIGTPIPVSSFTWDKLSPSEVGFGCGVTLRFSIASTPATSASVIHIISQ